jgi:hypothetical protein
MAAKIPEAQARALFIKHKLEPLVPFPGTQKPWKSKCLITGKTVSPTYGKVRDFGHRCSYCSGFKVDEVEAVALMKKAGFKTLVSYPGGSKPWKSQCLKCKKIHSPQYTSVKLGAGCKFCAHKAVDPKDAEKIMQSRGFKALEPYPGATKNWLVRCNKCKREFNTVFRSSNSLNGCKYCSGAKVDVKELLQKLKELKLKPLEEYQSAKVPWKCKCLVCNHTVQPTWNRIKQGRGHCAYCAQRRVDIPLAMKFMKSVGLKPLVDFPGSSKPWKCKCLACKLEVSPRWSDLQRGQGGCSNCADWGLNYQKPGYIYLITNERLKAHKIGIANSYKSKKYDDRMYQHEKQGWVLYKRADFETVQKASDIETSVLKWLRLEVGLPIFLSQNQMPNGGHTETVDAAEIDLPTIWEKIEELSRVKRLKKQRKPNG